MQYIIWDNGRWQIDNNGIIWLSSEVINRKVLIPAYVFKIQKRLGFNF